MIEMSDESSLTQNNMTAASGAVAADRDVCVHFEPHVFMCV